MTILSIRLPDDMAERLKTIEKHRFLAAQLRGNPKRAFQLLDELDEFGL